MSKFNGNGNGENNQEVVEEMNNAKGKGGEVSQNDVELPEIFQLLLEQDGYNFKKEYEKQLVAQEILLKNQQDEINSLVLKNKELNDLRVSDEVQFKLLQERLEKIMKSSNLAKQAAEEEKFRSQALEIELEQKNLEIEKMLYKEAELCGELYIDGYENNKKLQEKDSEIEQLKHMIKRALEKAEEFKGQLEAVSNLPRPNNMLDDQIDSGVNQGNQINNNNIGQSNQWYNNPLKNAGQYFTDGVFGMFNNRSNDEQINPHLNNTAVEQNIEIEREEARRGEQQDYQMFRKKSNTSNNNLNTGGKGPDDGGEVVIITSFDI